MEFIRARVLHDKAVHEVHTEMFDRRVQREKKDHARRLLALKRCLRKKIQVEARWVSPEEYFEGELWQRRLNYEELHVSDFPPCKCTKPVEYHESLSDKEYWIHRREVNRYRRMQMNLKAKRLLGEHTCPWKIMGSSI